MESEVPNKLPTKIYDPPIEAQIIGESDESVFVVLKPKVTTKKGKKLMTMEDYRQKWHDDYINKKKAKHPGKIGRPRKYETSDDYREMKRIYYIEVIKPRNELKKKLANESKLKNNTDSAKNDSN